MTEPDRDGGLRAQAERARADFQSAADDLLAVFKETQEHIAFLQVMHDGAPELAERWRIDGDPDMGGDGGRGV